MDRTPSSAENPRQRQSPNQMVNSYVTLLNQVRDAGFLRRRRGFYIVLFGIHTRHHNHPNMIEKDPDIHTGGIALHPQAAASRRGFMIRVTRRQGWLLFPLVFFLGLSLHVDSLKYLYRRGSLDHRWVEIPLIAMRLLVVPVLVFWLLPLGMAFAFLSVQVGVFGFYMDASFAPGHAHPAGLEPSAVGLFAGGPFECPVAVGSRPR